jgi:hypothetical protein
MVGLGGWEKGIQANRGSRLVGEIKGTQVSLSLGVKLVIIESLSRFRNGYDLGGNPPWLSDFACFFRLMEESREGRGEKGGQKGEQRE